MTPIIDVKCGTTLRTDALSAVGFSLSTIDRFRRALVLKMHDTATFGGSIAGFAGVDKRTGMDVVRLPADGATEALRNATKRKAYDLIVATFELHHLDPTERRFAAETIGRSLSDGGAFVMADYVLPAVTPSEFDGQVTSKNERANIELYGGIRPWFDAHAGWSETLMKELAMDTGMSHAMSEPLPGHGVVAVSSDDPIVVQRARQAVMPFRRFA